MNTETKPAPRILSEKEEYGLKGRITEETNERKETDMHYPVGGRVGMTPQVRKMKEVLRESENNKDITESQKKEFEKEAKLLKEWLARNMISQKNLRAKISRDGVMDTQTQKLVDHMARVEQGPEFQQKAARYKFIMRALLRPNEANLENFRPAT